MYISISLCQPYGRLQFVDSQEIDQNIGSPVIGCLNTPIEFRKTHGLSKELIWVMTSCHHESGKPISLARRRAILTVLF